jgi:glutaminyl-peptide cyclotransferase
MKYSVFIFLIIIFVSCTNNDAPAPDVTLPTTPAINYAVVKRYPHDTTAYTEGLLFHAGQLYESTGASPEAPGTRSLFGPIDSATGIINTKVEIDGKKYFGEGIVFLKNKWYQLTYENKIGFVYDGKTFKKVGEFSFPSPQGWGLTTDGINLVMTDGSSTITWLDPATFKTVKTISVRDEKGPVMYLNELEYIGKEIYANIFMTNTIVRIDPATGNVTGKLELTSLAIEALSTYKGSMQLNGIAYDSTSKRIFVTGKMWPSIFELKL